jgi:hypothetical protein
MGCLSSSKACCIFVAHRCRARMQHTAKGERSPVRTTDWVDLGYNFELVTVCKSKSPSLRKSHVGGWVGRDVFSEIEVLYSCAPYWPGSIMIPAVAVVRPKYRASYGTAQHVHEHVCMREKTGLEVKCVERSDDANFAKNKISQQRRRLPCCLDRNTLSRH